jgi:hypothetical protein
MPFNKNLLVPKYQSILSYINLKLNQNGGGAPTQLAVAIYVKKYPRPLQWLSHSGIGHPLCHEEELPGRPLDSC